MLFFTKLYIGLAANSISIYSDGINNLFDSLSGLIGFVCLMAVTKNSSGIIKTSVHKLEQLLSFVLSVLVSLAGVMFLYSSLERLMYPTPVWYLSSYLYILVFTALIKLGLFVFFRAGYKKSGSQIIKILYFDSLLDFFITSVTITGFMISHKGTYAADAFCGIAVSIIILISSVKLIASSVKRLINFIGRDSAEELQNILLEYGITMENSSVRFISEENSIVYLKTDVIIEKQEIAAIRASVAEKTGIELYVVN